MICMLCDARIFVPWEEGDAGLDRKRRELEWIELPKTELRRSPHHCCATCAREVARAYFNPEPKT